jgi:hypothetical protein
MLRDRELLGSELRDKIELYSELTGENGWNVPVARVADFISGFEMGMERFRKRGRWIECEDLGDKDVSYWCECSECHSERTYKTNFCPDCGAYMREDG